MGTFAQTSKKEGKKFKFEQYEGDRRWLIALLEQWLIFFIGVLRFGFITVIWFVFFGELRFGSMENLAPFVKTFCFDVGDPVKEKENEVISCDVAFSLKKNN